jgi:hypothetical protein
MNRLHLLLATAALALPAAAQAQALDTDSTSLALIGSVPALCTGGAVTGGDTTYDLGVLVDTATGLLRTDLSAPDKVMAGSFCSTRSTISVEATAMTAQSFAGVAPAGFSKDVHYTATASGWTTTPASFSTAAASNPGASQSRATAFSGDIAVGISGFATAGGNALRLVSDPQYRGQVIVTLTAAN